MKQNSNSFNYNVHNSFKLAYAGFFFVTQLTLGFDREKTMINVLLAMFM